MAENGHGGEISTLRTTIAKLRARYIMASAGGNRKLMKLLKRQISELENKIKNPEGLR